MHDFILRCILLFAFCIVFSPLSVTHQNRPPATHQLRTAVFQHAAVETALAFERQHCAFAVYYCSLSQRSGLDCADLLHS